MKHKLEMKLSSLAKVSIDSETFHSLHSFRCIRIPFLPALCGHS